MNEHESNTGDANDTGNDSSVVRALGITEDQQTRFNEKVPGEAIRSRRQGGKSLSYVEGWWVIDQLNQIVGQGNWSYTIRSLDVVSDYPYVKDGREGWRVAYRAIVAVTVHGTTFEDVGFGESTDYNSHGSAHEGAGKEAVTDAVKRAAKNFGYRLGLELYDKDRDKSGDGASKSQTATSQAANGPAAPAPSGDDSNIL